MERELVANFNPKILMSFKALVPPVGVALARAAPGGLLKLPLFDLVNEPREFGGEMV